MQPFLLNRHGQMIFPSNIIPELDFSTLDSLDQLDRRRRRDFETKAPTGTEILEKVQAGGYDSRYGLLRDLALNVFWANRFPAARVRLERKMTILRLVRLFSFTDNLTERLGEGRRCHHNPTTTTTSARARSGSTNGSGLRASIRREPCRPRQSAQARSK